MEWAVECIRSVNMNNEYFGMCPSSYLSELYMNELRCTGKGTAIFPENKPQYGTVGSLFTEERSRRLPQTWLFKGRVPPQPQQRFWDSSSSTQLLQLFMFGLEITIATHDEIPHDYSIPSDIEEQVRYQILYWSSFNIFFQWMYAYVLLSKVLEELGFLTTSPISFCSASNLRGSRILTAPYPLKMYAISKSSGFSHVTSKEN
ncbi:hypothetical protein RRG08_039214 [Elysia crispata]|uniref:Uncharacterized protein n=1 Tax=Elysia crispata TaxID=231223 RepID=A0AAE1E5B6_9GAST|nr:hypothetical protein RRG08_039214 [Elysia crispata]